MSGGNDWFVSQMRPPYFLIMISSEPMTVSEPIITVTASHAFPEIANDGTAELVIHQIDDVGRQPTQRVRLADVFAIVAVGEGEEMLVPEMAEAARRFNERRDR